ncbi:MAG TPA: AsmA family protein [Candidatus Omnitrophota bacterium]|nr:AsmA family protein [Candidatus Omnitrophota bacterium]HPB67618.1 AsmA family protein [Candidatus Omnitrophota bacterium]HQO58304.1 AsmA family protein [Candidatus Omnitrophota bacterium]HQP12558.1 AsmA family protein [Candidatus Omnitrophota bacterium]
MKKLIKFIAFVLIALVIGVIVAKNIVIKTGIEQGVKLVTGLPMKIASMDISFTKFYVHVQGMQLYNPEGFPEKIMVDVPEVYVNLDVPALMKKKIHVKEVRFYLKEFVLVKNADSKMNLDHLKALQPKAGEKPDQETAPAPGKKEMPAVQIDVLQLKVDKVVYKDYSKGGEPVITETKISLDERIENINDPNRLVQIIVFKTLTKTPFANLPDRNINGLKSVVSGTVDAASGLTHGVVDTTGKIIKGTTDTITNVIKFPFKSE